MDKIELKTDRIDEDFQPPQVAKEGGELEINLSKVTFINSTGIREWINWISLLSARKLFFIECRPAVVKQINSIAGFIPSSASILSFYAPFFCIETDEQKEVLFVHSRDYPNGQILNAGDFKDEKGQSWSLDVVPDKYFGFLKTHAPVTK